METFNTMRVTKKQITELTRTKKFNGFPPDYAFATDINGHYFEKPVFGVTGVELLVTTVDEYNVVSTKHIADVKTKKQYIDAVYDYLNN